MVNTIRNSPLLVPNEICFASRPIGWFGDALTDGLRRMFNPVPVFADSAALAAVGVDLTPLPEGLPDVRMEREVMEIRLWRTFAVVEATFWLKNLGEACEIEVGFPCLSTPGRTPHMGLCWTFRPW